MRRAAVEDRGRSAACRRDRRPRGAAMAMGSNPTWPCGDVTHATDAPAWTRASSETTGGTRPAVTRGAIVSRRSTICSPRAEAEGIEPRQVSGGATTPTRLIS